jgi:hypothetical protein
MKIEDMQKLLNKGKILGIFDKNILSLDYSSTAFTAALCCCIFCSDGCLDYQ